MTKPVKKVLEAIVSFLYDPTISRRDKQDLWLILSALRGPDNGDENIKQLTTARIRHRIGIDLALADELGISINGDNGSIDTDHITGSEHFMFHIIWAKKALERDEDSENY